MRRPPIASVVVMVWLCAGVPALASTPADLWTGRACAVDAPRGDGWAVEFGAASNVLPSGRRGGSLWSLDQTAATATLDGEQAAQGRRRPVAFEYSDGYKKRARIHKMASLATLPLFVGQYLVGKNLYDHPGESSSMRSAHGVLAGSTGVLFGVNSALGVWNLIEARKDPNHRALRTVHGILMLAADAGFVATGALAPDAEEGGTRYIDRRGTHRTVALTSMAIATASYVMMLFGGK